MMYYDAHCHLQSLRLVRAGFDPATLVDAGFKRIVVNGTRPDDWPAVAQLAELFPDLVLPSFGLHPWWANDRPAVSWRSQLHQQLLDHRGNVAIGEIGLDRWIDDFDMPAQEDAFLWQLEIASEFDMPVSIHCLKAWGRMLEILQSNPLPERGFLLHSYGGPIEMVEPFAKLGAYFSFCGYFLKEGKEKVREAFAEIPIERLLVETDAPDQCLPENLDQHPLIDVDSGERLNDPHNIVTIYQHAAGIRAMPIDQFSLQVETNFQRLFG